MRDSNTGSTLMLAWLQGLQSAVPEANWREQLPPLNGQLLWDLVKYSLLSRLYANELRDLVTSWCEAKKKVPDAQHGFYPRGAAALRNPSWVMNMMFILRLAQTRCPSNSPRLHAVFIDCKQVRDTIPREALWDHLHHSHASLLKLAQYYEGSVQEMHTFL